MNISRYLGQRHGIQVQEWTQQNLWETAFKKFELYGLSKQTISLQIL